MATPLKILFADDDLKYSLLLKRFLEKEGYDVAYTGNGMMALEQFPVVKPDLVLLDINMPGLNGFEVAEKIRENDRHVLIFFLSDRSDKTDRLKGFSLKGNDYLAKPFYPEELLARIKERFEVNPDVKVEEEIYHSLIPCSTIPQMKSVQATVRRWSLPVRQKFFVSSPVIQMSRSTVKSSYLLYGEMSLMPTPWL